LYIISTFFLVALASGVQAQSAKVLVTGTVIDKESEDVLPAVSILSGDPLRGIGRVEANGTFSVQVQEGATLVFRMLGYKDATVHLDGNRNLMIEMVTQANKLSETVIVGYQKKTRETVTGAATIISGEDLQDVPVANVMTLLQGKVAGLNIQNNNGLPGAVGTIRLRGLSNISIQGSGQGAFLQPTSPLFVIDGIPVDPNEGYSYGFQQAGPGMSPLSLIPQEDIA